MLNLKQNPSHSQKAPLFTEMISSAAVMGFIVLNL